MASDEVIKAAAFAKRGKNKHAVFLALEEPAMPRDIMLRVFGKKSENAFSIVSRALSDLQSEDLVEIVNPEEKTGRVYRLTKKGVAVRAFLKNEQLRLQRLRHAHSEHDVDM